MKYTLRISSFMKQMMHMRDDMGTGAHQSRLYVHVRVHMGSCKRAVLGLESQAISAWVTKHFGTFFN